jgi:hypothetical protein
MVKMLMGFVVYFLSFGGPYKHDMESATSTAVPGIQA